MTLCIGLNKLDKNKYGTPFRIQNGKSLVKYENKIIKKNASSKMTSKYF